MAEEFKAINTQEEFDAAIGARIKRERETVSKEFSGQLAERDSKIAGYEKQLGELNAALSAANEKAAGHDKAIAEKDAQLKAYETASAKTRIAHEYGLSYDAADFLKGDDEASIKKSAETLKGLLASTHGAPPLADPEGGKGGDQTRAALKGMLAGLKGE